MLTLSYLKNIIGKNITGITDLNKQVIESAAGYDGIVSLIQTKGVSPIIVLENSETGEFSCRPGGFLKTSQSVWVMKMVPRDGNRQAVQNECFLMMKRIISLFVEHQKDDELMEWEWGSIPWGIRNAGPNFTGYEFTVYFSENTDLSFNG